MACSRCGQAHPAGVDVCPVTNAPVEGGPCGTTIDRYYVERLLGRGGHGAVYRAKHVITERAVALKILIPGTAESDGFDRLVREARATSALGSPRIVQIFDAGVSERGDAFMAMELLDGCDLRTLAEREGPLSLARVIDLVVQLLEGLSDAHARGIVHRDVKPANVFVVRDAQTGAERVKVLDFGISKVNSPGVQPTLPGQAMGTPGYMAPEQFTSARDADPRADVWATGVIVFELLARDRPFHADSYEQWFVQVQGRARPLSEAAPHVPHPVGAVVDRALARDPDARWPSARAFADALRGAMGSASRSLPSFPIVSTMPTQRAPIASAVAPAPYPSHATTPALMPIAATPRPLPLATRSDGSHAALYAILGALVVLVLAVGGAVIWLATSRPTSTSTPAKSDPASDTKSPKKKAISDDDDDAPQSATTPATAAPLAVLHAPGIDIEEPQIVGQLDSKEVVAVLKRALPKMQVCRRAVADDVMAQIHVHPGPTITLAQAHPDNKGDPNAARCVAHHFEEAAPGWHPGETGIISFEVRLDAK